jgi:hypothetical protein
VLSFREVRISASFRSKTVTGAMRLKFFQIGMLFSKIFDDFILKNPSEPAHIPQI